MATNGPNRLVAVTAPDDQTADRREEKEWSHSRTVAQGAQNWEVQARKWQARAAVRATACTVPRARAFQSSPWRISI